MRRCLEKENKITDWKKKWTLSKAEDKYIYTYKKEKFLNYNYLNIALITNLNVVAKRKSEIDILHVEHFSYIEDSSVLYFSLLYIIKYTIILFVSLPSVII